MAILRVADTLNVAGGEKSGAPTGKKVEIIVQITYFRESFTFLIVNPSTALCHPSRQLTKQVTSYLLSVKGQFRHAAKPPVWRNLKVNNQFR